MLGAIAGDMIGARFERRPIKTDGFQLVPSTAGFTDDTVLTNAVAEASMTGGDDASALKSRALKYYHLPYGAAFRHRVAQSDSRPDITGGIAQAFYKSIPPKGVAHVQNGLPGDLLAVLDRFNHTFGCEF